MLSVLNQIISGNGLIPLKIFSTVIQAAIIS